VVLFFFLSPLFCLLLCDGCRLYYEDHVVAEVSRKLHIAIYNQSQNLPSHVFNTLISRLVDSGINLLTNESKDIKHKIAGLVVLDCLLDVECEIMPERRIEIANQLRKVLENERQNVEVEASVLRKAAAVIGHLAHVASTTEIEFLQDFYVTNAIKWLGDQRSEARFFSGVLILTQISINSPALIFAKRKNFFSVIWEVLFDKSLTIREAAAASLSSVLLLVSQREPFDEYVRLALQQMEIGFASTSSEKIHGSMIILDCMLKGSTIPIKELLNTIRNVNVRLQDLFWEILSRKDSKDANIKRQVIVLIPKLALTSPSTFVQRNQYTQPLNFLSYSVRHILNAIYGHKGREIGYISLGNLLVCMASALKGVNAIVDDVIQAIKKGFEEPFCIEALKCLSVVVQSSPSAHSFIDSTLISSMFLGGLTPDLISSLKVIVKVAPDIRGQVQARLRNQINHILLNHSVRKEDVGTSQHLRRTLSNPPPMNMNILGGFFSSKSTTNKTSKNSQGDEPSSDNELVLALKVLANFDFMPSQYITKVDMRNNESEMLLKVVREGVVRYLDDFNPDIRGAAAITCARVLDKVVDQFNENQLEDKYLIQVIDRLLMLGVGDENEDIRMNVFLNLPPSLDHVISSSENAHCLIEAMNDESFDVRSAAMSVLARVAHYDTVHVMPLARLMLSKLMRQLHNSKDQLLRLESVQLLQAMVRGTNELIIPYVSQIIDPLVALLDDPSSSIVCAAVSTIGELAIVSPQDIEDHLDTIFPKLIQALNDQSSVLKQEAAVVALGQFVSSLNIESDPFATYPILFESIVRAIQRSDINVGSLRYAAIKTFGLLGAVDADMYQKSVKSIAGGSTGLKGIQASCHQDDEEDMDVLEDDQLNSLDNYYLQVVMNALMAILLDSSLSLHHQTAATVTMRIVLILGSQCLSQLDNIVSGFAYRVMHTDSRAVQETLFDHLVTIVHVVGHHIIRTIDTLVKLVCDNFDTHLSRCLGMIEALCYTLYPQDFNSVLRAVIPLMVQLSRSEILQDSGEFLNRRMNEPSVVTGSPGGGSSKSSSLPKTRKILMTISNLAPSLGEYRRQLIPFTLKIMENTDIRYDSRREALCTVMHLANDSDDLNEFASRIIHPLLRLLSTSTPLVLQSGALTALSCIVCRLNISYLAFIIPAKRKISQLLQKDTSSTPVRIPQLDEYELLISLLLKQRTLPSEPAYADTIILKNRNIINSQREKAKSVQVSLRMEMQVLEAAWTLSGRTTESDLIEWMRRLSIEFIRQSPSPILRPCAILAKVYQPLANELFNAAFISIWDELFDLNANELSVQDDIPLIHGLETALSSPQIPSYIRAALLNLTEFMDMQDKAIPLNILLLAKQAEAASMYSKCLSYREMEFNSRNCLPSGECVEALIIVNNELGLREAASGVLQYVKLNYKHIRIEPFWLEKLNRWQEAKNSYIQESMTWKETYPDDCPAQHDEWMNSELGLLRCLHALGDYEDLTNSALEMKGYVERVEGQMDMYDSWMSEVTRLGASSAWMLGQWDNMEDFLVANGPFLRDSNEMQLSNNSSFFQAVLSIHNADYHTAMMLVSETREAVSSNISSLLSQSYSQAYKSMVTMQILAEMEELIDYKEYESRVLFGTTLGPSDVTVTEGFLHTSPHLGTFSALNNYTDFYDDEDNMMNSEILVDLRDKKTKLMGKWRKRLLSAPREVEVYTSILTVHTLLVDPKDDLDSWLDLVSICRKEGMLFLCENILKRLGATDILQNVEGDSTFLNFSSSHPKVTFAACKYWWATGKKTEALSALSSFIKVIDDGEDTDSSPFTFGTSLPVDCLLKRAEWIRYSNQGRLSNEQRQDVLDTVDRARTLAPDQYRVWHTWAVTNYDQLNVSLDIDALASSDIPPPPNMKSMQRYGSLGDPTTYAIEAIRGFSRSMTLGGKQGVNNLLEDTLRLLTLWFSYGTKKGVYDVLAVELKNVAPENWLGVIPQLIARMHVRAPEISILLRKLLIQVAITHPQALVCPISVALNTTNHQRKLSASAVMVEMRKNDYQLVEEAEMVSRELMRVAISPHEFWHEGLERAAQLYIGDKDIDGMIEVLLELHESMNKIFNSSRGATHTDTDADFAEVTPITASDVDTQTSLRDISFRHSYGRNLQMAGEWLGRFCQTREVVFLHQAWDLYQKVFKQISGQIKDFLKLELRHVSPALTRATNLRLAVPGTYRTQGDSLIHIRCFSPSVDIITSKERPRQMTVIGSDGIEYRFLLKGHEDLRQDERVMQLFGLINVCLESDRMTRNQGLNIVRYSVLPLSNNSGLIGWVENCDTLNALVKQYREVRDVKMSVEHKLLTTKAPNYEKLTLQQKVDVFLQVREATTGQDLAKMLWLKSKTSDVWVERRSNYTKSLAVMSMVGYILGLGDRHPSNLMLDRVAGRIVHIDFGDCFEVAMQRSKFPETVPFRLTRMLVKAMEISGIEGSFRSTSEKVTLCCVVLCCVVLYCIVCFE
jgi:serine/threonine-protein kinase mTOR